MNKNMLSAVMLLFFLLAGSVFFILHETCLWRGFVVAVTGIIVFEIIRHWQDIGEDIKLLFNAESPHKCRWFGSGLLIFLALLSLVVEAIDISFSLFIR